MKPGILLQVCCAPDASVAAERLREKYQVGVYFYNPNIQPEQEYDKRREELYRLAPQFDIQIHSAPYDPEAWLIAVKGYEQEPEKGARCEICFRIRLETTARAAKKLGYDFFGTVLTVSPHKDAELINRLGREIEKKVGVSYFESNFKKKNGFKRSLELSLQYNLYRQDYCGCVFSRHERMNRKD
jgi:predicted adenine nucleotide alpha hydrolase (AANH) superfamily ATPase